MKEIRPDELELLSKDSYILIDLRDEVSFNNGRLPGAVRLSESLVIEQYKEYEGDKTLIIYCLRGEASRRVVEELEEYDVEAVSLKGGYNAWLLNKIQKEEIKDNIDECITSLYNEKIYTKFEKAIKDYQLISAKDKIAVCISGGKDSMLMAKLFMILKSKNEYDFEPVFLVMDPGYNSFNRKVIENNAKKLEIPIEIFETQIFDSVDNIEKSPCYICARMRRGYLYNEAKLRGCNKIALGHHYDDVIETILMGMLYGGQVQTMMPKLRSTNFEGMELIRPLYYIREDDIIDFRDYNGLNFIQCACHFTETCETCHTDGTTSSKRLETKKLIARLKNDIPDVEENIFRSVENVNLNGIVKYKNKKGE
ncbi:tRNA(Ile)-lysidine synthase TilS/MesJ [Acetitomaculum ruminis DSM 5522]|uniref:tRNA(Ile)-lysidine synthase TilS/MesJ n=1 Tax=Acetitomaculum ruminis DSM 5522 TaxID=1120918 RepID=A0A1I1AHH3_9FIRM|nr:ATP-binding protein [Acetitomaculum ruminis]SFB35948.1 tRNA(Ile)-lysidine synthase TilS/MesJ [Acetitomaculum ruminis DSM 5522]